MIFAVFDPSPLTMCINCSFFTFITLSSIINTIQTTAKGNKVDSVTRVSQTSKERLVSDVFICLLKTDSDGEAMTSGGRPFQTRAAATPKGAITNALVECSAPTLTQNQVVVESRFQPHPQFMWKVWRSKTMQATEDDQRTNSIRRGVRSQCRSRNSRVIWSNFSAEHTSHAAALIKRFQRRPKSHCRNRGVSLPRTPSRQRCRMLEDWAANAADLSQ